MRLPDVQSGFVTALIISAIGNRRFHCRITKEMQFKMEKLLLVHPLTLSHRVNSYGKNKFTG